MNIKQFKPKCLTHLSIKCPDCNKNLRLSFNPLFEGNIEVYYCDNCFKVYDLLLVEINTTREWVESMKQRQVKENE